MLSRPSKTIYDVCSFPYLCICIYTHALEQGVWELGGGTTKGAWRGIAGIGILKDIPIVVETIDPKQLLQNNM